MLTEGDIQQIVARIVSGYSPPAVAIFGSYAIGTATERSDLDILVIKATGHPWRGRAHQVRRLLFGVLSPLDVCVFTPEEFEEDVEEELSFGWVIVRQARVYHWTEAAARLVPTLARRVGASDGSAAPAASGGRG